MKEREVYVTSNGLGRAAIVERYDRMLQIYVHWKWSEESRKAFNVVETAPATWFDDNTSAKALYENIEPQSGIYGSVELARRDLLNMPGFDDVKCVYRQK